MKKKYKKSKNQYKKPSKHHIIPTSRGGGSNLENIAKTNSKKHEFYHALFENQTPVEIVQYLVSDFWNNNWTYVHNAYVKNNQGIYTIQV